MNHQTFAAETRQLERFFARCNVPPSEAADAAQDTWVRLLELRARGRFTDGGLQPLAALRIQVLRERRRYHARRPITFGEILDDAQPLQLQTGARCRELKVGPRPRLTDDVKAAIKRDLAAGASVRSTAAKYGVTRASARRYGR